MQGHKISNGKSVLKSVFNGRKTASLAASIALGLTAAPSFALGTSDGWVGTKTFAHPLGSLLGSKDTLASGEAVHVVLSLKMRDEAALDSFLASQKIPGSPAYDRAMTPEQFPANFGPTTAQVQAVVDHLTASGFRNIEVAPNRLLVTADGTAGTVQAAFNTTIAHVQVGTRSAIANVTDVQVPAKLDGIVESVLGLQTADIYHTTSKRADHVVTAESLASNGGGASTEAKTQATHGFNPTAFPTIYHAGTTPTASATTVAIIAEGSLTNVLADFKSFLSQNGIAAFTPTVVKTGSSSTDTSGDAEWDLDSQDIISMAGGKVGQLIFYDGPSLSNSDLTTELNKVVTDNLAKVINVSLGECETSANSDGSLAADDKIFKQAQAQGQTFAVSTGDSGSNECTSSRTGTTPSSPASSPYVVAVGGTTLTASSSNAYTSETAWTDTGGSASTIEAQPTWQSGYVPNKTKRGLADVAFDADPNSGAIIIVDGSSEQYGGTSLAAPLFTASWARIESSHSNSLGFAAPLIYAAYGKSKTPFHDVTSGSNGAYTAKAGWDYPTGFGSFDIQLLNAAL
jgi:pseudomonalisin/xanthomonalisin